LSTLVRNGLGWSRTVRGNFCIDKGQLELRVVNGADLNLDVSFVFVGDCDISLQNLLLGPFTSRSDWALSICESHGSSVPNYKACSMRFRIGIVHLRFSRLFGFGLVSSVFHLLFDLSKETLELIDVIGIH